MSLCEYCKSRYSWDCDDGLAYPECGCENFTLDYCTLTDEQKEKIIDILTPKRSYYDEW